MSARDATRWQGSRAPSRATLGFDRGAAAVPFRHEAKHVLPRWLRRERFEPLDGNRSDVRKLVNAADSRPDNAAWSDRIRATVQRGFDFAPQNEIRLFKRVIVKGDIGSGLVLDEQESMVHGARRLIDQPLQEHAGREARWA